MLKQKEQGAAHSLLFSMASVFVISLLMIVFLPLLGILYTCNDVQTIKRQYLLRMEHVGYLSEADEQDMIDSIMNIGDVQNVTINPATTEETDPVLPTYGQEITLDFTIELDAEIFSFPTLFDTTSEKEGFVKNFKATSTSKY